MREIYIYGILLFSLMGTLVWADAQIPMTLSGKSQTIVETQTVNVDVFVYGDISPTLSKYFSAPPKNSSSPYGISDVDQVICSQIGPAMIAVHSDREAVPYAALTGKMISYSKTYSKLNLLSWRRGLRPTIDSVIVSENPDEFFADIKDEMLADLVRRFPARPKDLAEVKDFLVLGHITSVTCQQTMSSPPP